MDNDRLESVLGTMFDAEDLCEIGAYEESIALCDEILAECLQSEDPDTSGAVAETMLLRGTALAGMERYEEELREYEEVARRFESDESPDLSALVARARFNAAVVTGQLGRIDESSARYASFIERYQGDRQLEILEQVARALLNWAITLLHSSSENEALALLDDLIMRYGESDAPEFYVTVVRALASKAALELQLGQAAAAIESASRGVAKCGPEIPVERFHCHVVLTTAHLVAKDTPSGVRQIESILEFLPDLDGHPCAEGFGFMLRTMAETIGRDRTLDIVRASPSAEMLSPLIETLKSEIRRESETLKSIEEMAKDLQGDFARFGRFEI